MTNEHSGHPPDGDEEPGDPRFRWPTGDESPAEVGGEVVRGLTSVIVGRVMFLQSFVWLLLGAGFLLGAFALVREEMGRRDALAAFDGRAPGTIEAPFWRLDYDPELLGDGTNWMPFVRREACARLRFQPEGGEQVTTAYCRRFASGISGGHSLTWEEALGPMPVRWVDERGMPRFELRLSPRLARWLENRGPELDVFYDAESFHGPEAARRADRLLASVWREIDDPFLRLLEEWSKPPPVVTVAYAREDPARAAPLPLLEDEYTVPAEGAPIPGWVLAILLGSIGTLCWAAGSYLATFRSRWGTAALVVTGLAVLPWAGGFAGKALGYLWGDAELALEFIRSEMLDLPPELVPAAPADEGDPEAEVLIWSLETSSYAGLLRWIELQPPAEATTDDGVLRHLADRVLRQAVALPDEELARLLAWAASVQERGGGEEIGLLFVDAAVELAGDEARADEVRRQAERLLAAVALHPPSDNPYRLAVAERGRILERVPGL